MSLKYARIWKGQKLYNEPYPLIITNQRFVQDLKVCFTNPQPGRAMTSRSHLPSLSGNKLDYHPLPAGSPLLSLYDKCFPCFMTRSTASGSGMTGPRSGTWPPGGSRPTTSCCSWRKARHWRTSVMQTFHDRVQLGGEEDSNKYTWFFDAILGFL